jgi:hypothetical protein
MFRYGFGHRSHPADSYFSYLAVAFSSSFAIAGTPGLLNFKPDKAIPSGK